MKYPKHLDMDNELVEEYRGYGIYKFESYKGEAFNIQKKEKEVTSCMTLEYAKYLIEEDINNDLIQNQFKN